MKINNLEEVIVGAVVGFVFIPYIHFHVLWLSPLTAILWWLGGASMYALQQIVSMPDKVADFFTQKLWRRLGVPVVICVTLAIYLKSWIPLVSGPALWGVLTIGYGVPSIATDGSPLGKAVCAFLGLQPEYSHRDKTTADIMIRGTIGVLMGLTMLSLFFIAPHVKWYLLTVSLGMMYPLTVLMVD